MSYESLNGEGNQILNDSGVIVASADTSIPDPNAPDFCFNFHPDGCFITHATRWKHGIVTDLGALPGVNSSAAAAINARGWAAGASQNGAIDPVTGGPAIHAVLWKEDEIIDLGTLGGSESLGLDISDSDQVIGMSTIDDSLDPFANLLSHFVGVPFPSPTHPFIRKHGEMIDLGTLGGPDAFVASGCVNQILAVGSSLTSATLATAILALRCGEMIHPFVVLR